MKFFDTFECVLKIYNSNPNIQTFQRINGLDHIHLIEVILHVRIHCRLCISLIFPRYVLVPSFRLIALQQLYLSLDLNILQQAFKKKIADVICFVFNPTRTNFLFPGPYKRYTRWIPEFLDMPSTVMRNPGHINSKCAGVNDLLEMWGIM